VEEDGDTGTHHEFCDCLYAYLYITLVPDADSITTGVFNISLDVLIYRQNLVRILQGSRTSTGGYFKGGTLNKVCVIY